VLFDTRAITEPTKGGEKGRMETAVKQVEIGGNASLLHRPFQCHFRPAKHLISSGLQPIPVYSTGAGLKPVSIFLFRDSLNLPIRVCLCLSVAKNSAHSGQKRFASGVIRVNQGKSGLKNKNINFPTWERHRPGGRPHPGQNRSRYFKWAPCIGPRLWRSPAAAVWRNAAPRASHTVALPKPSCCRKTFAIFGKSV
jgi:hypothetical protein